jgi:hypothetical protein
MGRIGIVPANTPGNLSQLWQAVKNGKRDNICFDYPAWPLKKGGFQNRMIGNAFSLPLFES